MYAAVPEEVREKKKATIPLRRYGTPEDVANLAAFLASEDSSYITGQTITIDGGRN
ncbi:MAG: SDR family oxidoreductase, partial [Firmicutes bacterium]|nr:SDR family oxidoreductase [Bacillota bacterium]